MMERLKKWTGWRAALKTVCFLLLLALVLGRADRILALKNDYGIYDASHFYTLEPESVDVLALGTSHAYLGIHTGVLWEDYGIASYVFGCGGQPFWTAYCFLEEALKTQTPELIVLDAYAAVYQEDYGDEVTRASGTLGLKWSRNKIRAVGLGVPPESQKDYLLSFRLYHDRFRELSGEDFLPYKGDPAQYACRKGSWAYTRVRVFEDGEIEAFFTEDRAPMTAKTEEWYRKTIELAQSRGIPLLIVLTPYAGIRKADQAFFNTAADIAGEYGVPFVNFNLDFDAMGFDFSSDCADRAHLNARGSRKYTKALGALIAEEYGLPDRRGDPAYRSWEDNARYLAAVARDFDLSEGVSAGAAASLLPDPDYTCAVGVSGGGGTAFAPLLEALGVPAGEEGLWLVSGGGALWASGAEGTEYFTLDGHDLKLSRTGGGNAMVFDKGGVEQVRDGVTIFVYDSATQAEAARLAFDAADLSQ